jgi:16S rRNA (guanine527-N7)-methyltransferase
MLICARMLADEIAALLAPFCAPLSNSQISQLAAYLDLLLRWNARVNLTAVRDIKSIVTRHFGEALWTADRLFTGPSLRAATVGAGTGAPSSNDLALAVAAHQLIVADVGSGAGFPGLPLKIFAPAIRLTLIESQNKKATFLKEVIRTLGLDDVDVYTGRAEQYGKRASLVTLRAVEKFDAVLPVAAGLLNGPGSRIALLIGRQQRQRAEVLVPHLGWEQAGTVPLATNRILLIGTKP